MRNIDTVIKRTIIRDGLSDTEIHIGSKKTRQVSIFDLPFEKIWYLPLIGWCFVHCCVVLVELSYYFHLKYEHNVFNIIYLIDICLVGLYKYLYPHYEVPGRDLRPYKLLLVELIATIPFYELCVKDTALYEILKSLQVLKFIRVIHHFHLRHNQISIGLAHRLILLVICMIFTTFLSFTLVYHIYTNFGTHPSRQEWFNLYVMFDKLSNWGFSSTRTDFVLEGIMTSCIILDMYVIKALILSRIGNDFLMFNRHKYYLKMLLKYVLAEMKMLHAPKSMYQSVLKYFKDSWTHFRGYNLTSSNINFIQQGLRTEILLDIYCMAFKHSKVFRGADVRHVRFLSKLCTRKIYQQDEYIFEKGEMKSKMIYVVSGIVQILSEEDDETAIISLSSGTCLGESTLFLPYVSGSAVRCKGYTEVQELDITNFSKLAVIFPETHRKMHKEIMERYKESKELRKMSNYFRNEASKDDCTISWIKYMLRQLMNMNNEEFVNLYLTAEVEQTKAIKKMFSTKYLDLLVLSTGVELDETSEFFTTTFPLIVNPNGVLIKLWNFWICILSIFILIILPKYVFYTEFEIPTYITKTFKVINFCFLLDLIIWICTAVKTSETILLNVKSIALYRITTYTFLIDVLAALPLQMFSCISIKKGVGFSSMLLDINKIFKAWRLWTMVKYIQENYNINLKIGFSVTCTTVILYLIYCWSYIFYYANCNFKFHNCNYDEHYSTVFSATQLVTGVGLRSSIDSAYHNGFVALVCYFSSCILIIILLVSMTSSYILHNTSYLLLETLKIELMNVIKLYQINKNLIRRLMHYIDGQLSFDDGTNLIQHNIKTQGLFTEEFKLIMENEFSYEVRQLKFFRDFPDVVISKICSLVQYTLLPPNEVVCYAGDMVMDVMYILTKGKCQFISKYNQRESKGCEIINPMVCTCNTPIIHTCITKTYCLILSINYIKMLDIIEKHYMYMLNFQNLAIDTLEPLKLLIDEDASPFIYEQSRTVRKIISFVTFGKSSQSTYNKYEFHRIFRNLSACKLLRYVLMRRTVHPNGKFIYYWEMSRCFFAFTSNIANGLVLVIISENVFVKIFLYFLDITAYIDFYVRLHYCYYNNSGLLISHPYLTAKQYLSHNFIVDLIGVFPWRVLIPNIKPWQILIANSIRLVQMYRYTGFIAYKEMNVSTTKDQYYLFILLPTLILFSIYFGSFAVTISCMFGDNININPRYFEEGVYCEIDSWITDSSFYKPLSPLRVQLYGIYMAASLLSNTGAQGFSLERFKDGILCSILSLLGALYIMMVFARVTLHHTRGSYDLSLYQATLSNLKSYMIMKKVDKFIQKFAIKYYNFRWKREKGRNLCDLLNVIHYTLKEDILFNIYGESMLNYSIFSYGSNQFIKKVLSKAVHECLLINVNVLCVNDICSKIYIIYKGFVSIYLPEGTKLDVIGPGGIFGNLDNKRYNRIKVKVVTKTHLEVLHMDALQFYKIIKLWPRILKEFNQMKAAYMYYLPTKNIDTRAMEISLEYGKDEFKQKKSNKWYVNLWFKFAYRVFDPNSTHITAWSFLNVFTCYLTLYMYALQVAFSFYLVGITLIQYLFDLIYIIYNFYIVHHLSYEDEKGIIINDIRIIRKHNQRKTKSNILLLIHLPYDILLFAIPNISVRYTLFKLFRINRLLRYHDIYKYYSKYSDEVSLNIYMFELLYVAVNVILLLHSITCSIIFISTFFDFNMNIYVPQNMEEISFTDKVRLYITYLYMVVCYICKVGIDSHAPDGSVLILYTTLFIIFCPIIHTEVYGKDFRVVFKKNLLRKIYYDKISSLKHVMNKQEVSGQIVKKAFRYAKLLWFKQTGVLCPYLLAVAPKHLQEYINCASYSYNINNHYLFKKCHIDFKRQLCNFIDYNLYFPGDYITFKHSLNGTMYIIRKGEIEVLDEDEHWNETSVDILYGLQCFGIRQGLYPAVPQTYSYRAIRYSVVLILKLERWSHLLRHFPASKEIIYKCLEELSV